MTVLFIVCNRIPEKLGSSFYLVFVKKIWEASLCLFILTELANKPREKFQWDDREISYAMKHISKVAKIIKPEITITLLHDETDNKILECARAANADLIVTGDKHLLSLKEFFGIGITRIAGFLYTLEAK